MKSFWIALTVLFLHTSDLSAQIGDARADQDIVFNDLTKKYLADRRYANVEGNPFITDNWSVGRMVLSNGKEFPLNRMKLDLVSQELIYLDGQNAQKIAPPSEVKMFELTVNGKKSIFKTGYPPIEHQTKDSFYQEVLADKVALLKFSQKEIVQRDEFDKKKTFILYEDYYAFYDGTITPLRNKNSLSKVFQEKGKAITSYISDNKLKVRNEEDMINLIKFVNSQL